MTDNIVSIHHCSILVQDTGRSLDFYQAILGLKVNEERPDLGYPGAWLEVGEQQIHLLELPDPDAQSQRPSHGGRDRHVALLVKSLDSVVNNLEKNNCSYTLSKSGRRALFFRDPDGNAIEIIEAK